METELHFHAKGEERNSSKTGLLPSMGRQTCITSSGAKIAVSLGVAWVASRAGQLVCTQGL